MIVSTSAVDQYAVTGPSAKLLNVRTAWSASCLNESTRPTRGKMNHRTAPSIDEVWAQIKSLEGQEFQTKSGKPFTYIVSGHTLRVSRTSYGLSISEFAKVLGRVPFKGPGTVSNDVRGPSYIWSILHDSRVLSFGDRIKSVAQ